MKRTVFAGTLIALIAGYHLFLAPPTRVADDFYQFWVIGQAIGSMNVTNVYNGSERSDIRSEFYRRAREGDSAHELRSIKVRRNLRPAGTPFLYATVKLFSTGRYDADYRIFRFLSSAFFLAGLLFLCRLRGITVVETAALLIVLTFLSLPYRIEVRSANTNQLQVGALALVLFLRKRPVSDLRETVSVFALAVLVLFKPNLYLAAAALGFYWLFHGNARSWAFQALGVALALALAYLLPRIMFGGACTWPNWVDGFRQIASRPYYLNTSFPAFLFPSDKWTASRVLTLISLAIPMAVVLSPRLRWPEKDLRDRREEALALGMGICGYLLSAALVHGHYFVLLAPLFVMLLPTTQDPMTSGSARGPWVRRVIIVLALALVANPFLLRYGLTPKRTHSLGTYAGCLLLYLLSIKDLARMRAGKDLEDRTFPGSTVA